MKIIMVHGIHATRKPATSQLAPFVKSYLVARGYHVDVEVHRYGLALAMPRILTGDWLNTRRARMLAKRVPVGEQVVVVGHSNGCTIAHILQKLYRHLAGLVLFQPALDNDVAFTGTDRVLVIYNEKDDVVEHSRWAWFNSWGNMGRVGYKGPSQNVEQIDSMAPPSSPPFPYSAHCGFVENGEAVLQSWGEEVGRWIEVNFLANKE